MVSADAAFDLSGKHTDLSLPPGSAPSGPLGANQEMVTTPTGVVTVDVRDGRTAPLSQPLQAQRLLGWSPDGGYIAFLDLLGNPQVVNLKAGHRTSLPNPGPTVGARWENDSRWVAVQGLYGAAVMRVSDGKVIDLGPLTVVSW